jgi:acyl-coenzyme A synthetase/AMP-(fatty) acid ligase
MVAFLVPGVTKPAHKELLDYLHKKLPNYMIPTAFYWLDMLPLTLNGKINRKALISEFSESLKG